LKTVRDACELQPNALSIKLSDQIEQLDQLITAEGDGAAFFEKTKITQGMQDLITEGVARLAGASAQAVFHLKQAMGGGKTHLLVGFGLLAKHPELRKAYCGDTLYGSAFGSARTAAFNGRNNPDHFFWGEIAGQLGKGDQFRSFWTSGPKAPDEKDWLKLFDGGEPILILFDELPPYFHYLDTQKVGNGTVADIATRAFANLLTAAGKKTNVCVVVSDLAATYDTGTRLINRALEDARQELGHQEHNITPVDLASNEIYDILRKRLFKSLPDTAERADIAASYGKRLEEASKSKVANRGAEAIADEVAATYPFHPGGPRQAHRDLRHARRHRQGPVGRQCLGARPGGGSEDRARSRHPGWFAAAYLQPFHCRERRQGAYTGGDGRVPGFAAARGLGFPFGFR
jgi:hypothetical protein